MYEQSDKIMPFLFISPQPASLSPQYQDMLLLPHHPRNPVPNAAAACPPAPVPAQAPAPSNPPQPMDAGPPFKKIRLGDAKQEMQPLRVDTRVHK